MNTRLRQGVSIGLIVFFVASSILCCCFSKSSQAFEQSANSSFSIFQNNQESHSCCQQRAQQNTSSHHKQCQCGKIVGLVVEQKGEALNEHKSSFTTDHDVWAIMALSNWTTPDETFKNTGQDLKTTKRHSPFYIQTHQLRI